MDFDRCYKLEHPTLNFIRTTLGLNKKLKVLRNPHQSLFNSLLASTNLKLEEIKVDGYFGKYADLQRNCELYLESQKERLETVIIKKVKGAGIVKTVLSMQRLKTLFLTLYHSNPSEYEATNFPKNNSITDLCLRIYTPESIIYKHILDAVPKVEILHVTILDHKLAEWIPETCKLLKRLSLYIFDVESISNETFYMNLQEFSCRHVHRSKNLFKNLNGEVID